MDAVKSGGMAYLGGKGFEAMGGGTPVGSSGGAPVAEGTFTPASSIGKGFGPDALVPSSVANLTSATPQFIDASDTLANPIGSNLQTTATPLQASVEAPIQTPNAPTSEYTGGFKGTVPTAQNTFGSNIGSGIGAPSAYVNQAVANTTPTSWMQAAKNWAVENPYYAGAAGVAGLMALKGAAKNNSVTKAPDNRRVKFFGGNPYSGAGAMYERPVLAATGGIVALSGGGRTEDGARRYDIGGDVAAQLQDAYQNGSGNLQDLINTNNVTQADVAKYFPGFDVAGAGLTLPSQPAASTGITALAPTPAADNWQPSLTPITPSANDVIASNDPAQILNALQNKTISQADLTAAGWGTPTQAATAAPAPTTTTPAAKQAITDQQVLDWFKSNPNASDTAISQAMTQYGVTPDQIQRVTGVSTNDVASRLGLVNTIGAEGTLLGAAPQNNPLGSAYDQSWAKFMDTQLGAGKDKATAAMEVARATGLPLDQVTARYDAAETAMTNAAKAAADKLAADKAAAALKAQQDAAALKAQQDAAALKAQQDALAAAAAVGNKTQTNTASPTLDNNGYFVPVTGPTTTSNGQTYNPGYISNTANPTTAQGIGGAHAFVDANGYISQSPAMPFRPLGGYGTARQMKNAWTQSGGSLGHVNPAPVAHNMDAGTQHYLNMLSGNEPMTKTPYTSNGVIASPYYNSVMGMPLNPKYEVSQPGNAHYDPAFSASADYVGAYAPGYTGEAAPALDPKTIEYLKGKGVNVGSNPAPASNVSGVNAGQTISIPGANGTPPKTATQLTDYPGFYYGVDGKYYDAKGNVVAGSDAEFKNVVSAKAGGLMALAGGGMSSMNVGTLGGYSDGGRLLRGPGDGISDSIPATIGAHNPQPARLADGEFVVPARIVSELGNGSTEAGARKLYQMMDRVQNARKKTVGKHQVAANPRAEKYLPA